MPSSAIPFKCDVNTMSEIDDAFDLFHGSVIISSAREDSDDEI